MMNPQFDQDMRFFQFEHLSGPPFETSRKVYALARDMVEYLPESAEKSAGLRKLLEAKDCFVRASLDWDGHVDTALAVANERGER
jgi:hypothetical protein